MATAHKEDEYETTGDVTGEYGRPNAVAAFKIFDTEIKSKLTHIATIKGDCSEPYKRIKDDCNFPRPVMNFIIALENMEDAKRDHFLLALSEGLKARRIFMPRDLVTMASGEEGSNVVPLGERRDAGLATLAEEEAGEEFEEMAEAELEAQVDRPKRAPKPTLGEVAAKKKHAGTASDAIAAMGAEAGDGQ